MSEEEKESMSLAQLFALKRHYDKKSVEISLLIEQHIERMKLREDRD